MTLDIYAFEMLTGQRLTPLPASKKSWKVAVNADETITCTIPADDPGVKKLRIWESTVLARNGLLAVADGIPVAAGPIWKRRFNEDEGVIELTAGGLRSYFNRRVLLPVAARTTPLVKSDGYPDTSLDVVVNGVSPGTKAKRWVQLSRAWPGGAIPMTFPQADELVADATDTVKAIDLKHLGSLLGDLANVIGGPDIEFRVRYNADQSGILWEMRYGTVATPRLGSTDAAATEWSYGAPAATAYGLSIDEDASEVASQAWASGGNGNDVVLIARAELPKLPAAGFPLLESTNTGNSSVVLQSNIQAKADQDAYLGQYVASFWSMKVRSRASVVNGIARGPLLGDYWVGDLATIGIDKSNPFGLPPGKTVRRIASISGDEQNDDYDIAFGEVLA